MSAQNKFKGKIKTIDINAKQWFDKVNGNSYFSAIVTVNYGLKNETSISLPFQYGYGDHYKYEAFKALGTANIIKDRQHHNNGSAEQLWAYCDARKIILRTNKQENCKKREL